MGSKPRKARDVASVLQYIAKGDYKLNQSNLIYDGRKLFFNLTFSFEKSYNELEFNEGTELIVNFVDL
ncbi:TPA: hypothetical protein ACH6J6_002698, partial [Enterococcus faecium]